MPSLSQPSKIIQCTDVTSCFQAIYNFFFAILIALAFIYFLYGAFQYLLSAGGVYPKDEGKKKMINSIIAVIVALVIPLILNMINPGIFNAVLQIPKVKATLPDYTFGVAGGIPGTDIESSWYGNTIKGNPQCKIPTSGPCSPEELKANLVDGPKNNQQNLKYFSLICVNESHSNPSQESLVDKCFDGNSFSFGLFQINMAANDFTLSDGTNCNHSSIFEFTEGNGLKRLEDKRYNCRVKQGQENLYKKCSEALKEARFNIFKAENLYNKSGGFRPWSAWELIKTKCPDISSI
jgi:hypothetical protein